MGSYVKSHIGLDFYEIARLCTLIFVNEIQFIQ